MDRFIHFAVAAAKQAITDSGFIAETEEQNTALGNGWLWNWRPSAIEKQFYK